MSRSISFYSRLAALFIGLLLAACAPNPTLVPIPASTPLFVSTSTLRSIATPAPTATSTIAVLPASPPTLQPAMIQSPRIEVLIDHLPGVDDLALAPDGSIYVSNVNDGTIKSYTSDGHLKLIASGLSEPEGMIVLPDGSLLIAEQGKNRLVRFDFATQKVMPFFDLVNQTSQAGVDGIALDAHTPTDVTIIIPDSPNGTVLRVGLDGKLRGVIGRGFIRPTDAWVEKDGSLLVVDENAGDLKRIHPDGALDLLAKLPVPDDVIEDEAGNIFVNTLTDNAIHLIAAHSKLASVFVKDLSGPQGIIFDEQGNLIVADSGHNRLIRIVIR